MPQRHPDETKAQTRLLCETTAMTYQEIGAAVGVPAPTIGYWKRTEGWTRPPEALQRRPIPRRKRNAAIRLCQAGGNPDDLAEILECHRRTAQRLRHEVHDGLEPPAAFAPDEAAALHAALAGGGLDRRTLLRLAEEALARAILDALARRDPHARTSRARSRPSECCRTRRRQAEFSCMTAHPDLPPSTRPTLSWRTLRAILRVSGAEGRLKEFLATPAAADAAGAL